ncbi:MAG: OB-fold domain-containing protein, partial [Candidatus Hodarchaeota archaeon]
QIHYGPSAFQSYVPYTIGILELEKENLRIMGWIKTPVEELQVGMNFIWELKSGNADNYLLFLTPL